MYNVVARLLSYLFCVVADTYTNYKLPRKYTLKTNLLSLLTEDKLKKAAV